MAINKGDAKKLTEANRTLRSQNKALKDANEDLKGKVDAATEKAEAMEQKAKAAETRLAKANGAFGRLMDAVSAWVDAHNGLQRILRTVKRLSEVHRDKIEARFDATAKRGAKAILRASDDLESLLAAEQEVKQGTRIFRALQTAAKEDQDPDDLLDDMEL